MPINGPLRRQILHYCKRDIPAKYMVENDYSFIDDLEIKTAVVQEFLSARYLYKLGEALAVEENDLRPHSKFQVMQYASIYEAIIGWMLWDKLGCHPLVDKLRSVEVTKKLSSFPESVTAATRGGEEVFLAHKKTVVAPQHKIKFSDKLKVAVELGFLDETLSKEIEVFFAERNGIHIENAVKNDINFELDLAKRAFWRLQPFRVGIVAFLKTGVMPDNAKIAAV